MNRIHRMSPWIVGYSGGTGGPYSFYAFITGPDGEGMMDLNSLVDSSQRVILIQATDIDNEAGHCYCRHPAAGNLCLDAFWLGLYQIYGAAQEIRRPDVASIKGFQQPQTRLWSKLFSKRAKKILYVRKSLMDYTLVRFVRPSMKSYAD